jgi:hypothetical protein
MTVPIRLRGALPLSLVPLALVAPSPPTTRRPPRTAR